ncbi:MAG: L-lactate dehydrogenase (cytochrome) [Mariniblastus sp.]|jgi:L-lactate dehydrogenase (cytochrome)
MNLEEVKKDFIADFPSTPDLKRKAKNRIPRFAYEYLPRGCNDDLNLLKNKSDIQLVELMPTYIAKHPSSSMKTTLFGKEYDSPFGVAPIGLQGMIWPNSPEILARDIRNGLAMPPKMTLSNILQMFGRPRWVYNTLK